MGARPQRSISAPDLEEQARKGRLLLAVLRTMVAVGLLAMVTSFFDPHNDVRITLAFYAPIFLGVFALHRGVRRGRVMLVAWLVSLFFWALIAFVTLSFGGMQGENAACFAVCAMLIASVVSGRAGVWVAVASSAWCAMVVALELTGSLPRPLAPYSPINAWAALSVSLIMVTVLMRNALDSMAATHARAVAAGKERDEALRRSIQAQKMELVGNLASGVAHDFNNLLTVISAVARSLRRDLDGGVASAPEMLDDLDEATSRAILMTRQLLSFGRDQPIELTDVDLGAAARRIAPMLQRLMGERITIEVTGATAAVARATQVGVEQILLNLAVNARDAMPNGGVVRIVVALEAEVVRLEIGDEGVGIDEATRAKIFQPFFTTKEAGTGLGLATVMAKVVQFGGSIDVHSEVGRGTTFVIRLVRGGAPDTLDVTAATPPTDDAAGVRRLLVVDDDPLVRRATTRLLEDAGFVVVTASHGAEALALVTGAHGFACVVSDIAMPVLDGEALAERLREVAPALPVVLMSGHRQPIIDGPRRAFVAKPPERATLLAAIAEVCAAPPPRDRRT